MNEPNVPEGTNAALTELYNKAYRLGQERMRERIATHFQTYGLDAQADTIRALPVEE